MIVREDLFRWALSLLPVCLHYKADADARSIYNTPSTFPWYVLGLVLQWLKRQGGVAAIEAINRRKALINYID